MENTQQVKFAPHSSYSYYIYYHKADFDGFVSQLILYNYLKSKSVKDIIRVPYNYNDDINFAEFEKLSEDERDFVRVIFADVTPYQKPNYIKRLYELFGNNFIIIDHHATALDWLTQFYKTLGDNNPLIPFNGLRTVGFAGCELSYLWTLLNETHRKELNLFNARFECNPDNSDVDGDTLNLIEIYQKQVPRSVKLFGRFDVHDIKDTYNVASWEIVENFQYGMRAYPINFYKPLEETEHTKILEQLLFKPDTHVTNDYINEIVVNGKSVCDYIGSRNNKIVQLRDPIRVRFMTKFGRKISHSKAYFANDTLNNSKVFEDSGIYGDPSALYVLAHYNILKGEYSVTLYSTDDSTYDVGKICTIMGGGGHEHCGGFTCEFINFNDNKNNKINVLTIR